MTQVPTVEEIHEMHDRVLEEGQPEGTRHPSPDTILKRILDDAVQQPSVYHTAALLWRRITTSHVYEDGNHRTGLLAAIDTLERNDVAMAPSEGELYPVAKSIKRFEIDELSEFLETGSIDEDKLRDV